MKKLLIVVMVLLILLTFLIATVPTSADGPPAGSPGWSHVCPGQGGSDNPGPGGGGDSSGSGGS